MSDETNAASPDDIASMSSEQLARLVLSTSDALTRMTHERDEHKRRAEFLLRELERLRDLQKTPREHVDKGQIQLAFAQLAKELLETMAPPPPAEGTSGSSGDSPEGPAKKPRNSTPHGRSILPEHLPVRTISLAPDPLPEGALFIRNEVS